MLLSWSFQLELNGHDRDRDNRTAAICPKCWFVGHLKTKTKNKNKTKDETGSRTGGVGDARLLRTIKQESFVEDTVCHLRALPINSETEQTMLVVLVKRTRHWTGLS